MAEIALLIEAALLFFWLSRRLRLSFNVWGAIGKGVVASLIGGAAAYGLAVSVPGSAIWTSLIGMTAGGLLCLPIIWSEIKLLLRL
jgi:hypothetical protein